MGLKKLLSLECLFSVLCSKRRVISGLLASVLVLSLLFSVGSNVGGATVASSPSSLLSWFFSMPGNGSLVEEGRVSDNTRGKNLIGREGSAWEEEGVLENSNERTAGQRSPDVEGTHAGKSSVNDTVEESNELQQEGSWQVSHDGNFTGVGIGGVPVKAGVLDKSKEGGLSANLTNRRSPDGEESQLPMKTHMTSLPMQDGNTSHSIIAKSEEKPNITNLLGGRRNGNLGSGERKETHAAADGDQGSNPRMVSSGLQRKCDIFSGRWVKDENKPYYPPSSCPVVDRSFNCHKNGRPDFEFLRWKWQPNDCEIPSLNATDFLERLRGQRLIFVGDSLNRNMWESLVCILRNSVKKKKSVYEMSGRKQFKTDGCYSIRFKDYNCSVDFVTSPFLVREMYHSSVNGLADEKLRLDVMDTMASAYREADIVVFNTGHWWTHEKTSKGINYYQEGDHVYPILKAMEAYKKALSTWARWVDKNINPNKTLVVFRGYSLTHFRGGQWNSGGQCHKETEPIFNENFMGEYPAKMRALEQVLKQMKTPVIYLNISRLTEYRKDGHPSIYRKKYNSIEEQINAEKSQDCSHWCLPGVPDTWNELLYASLLMVGRGSWKK